MQALKLNTDPASKKQWSARVKTLLSEAERIKSGQTVYPLTSTHTPERIKQVDSPNIKRLKEPLSTRNLSTSEKIILLKASHLNGFSFPPWQKEPDSSDFELRDDGSLFT